MAHRCSDNRGPTVVTLQILYVRIHDFIHDMLVVPFQDTHNTVLHYAAEFGHVKITDMLIEKYGMDPTTESKVSSNIIYVHTSL